MNRDLTWRMSAACIGLAPLFDYAPDDDPRRRRREEPKAQRSRHARAKAICARCPVTEACRADTLRGRDEGVRFGVVLPALDQSKQRRAS